MSQHVHDRLRELETDVQHLHLLPAAAVRARGRRRGRRQLAVTMAAVAVLAATAGVTATRTFDRPNQPTGNDLGASPEMSCDLSMPADPAEVRIRLVDGGAPADVSGTVATQLRNRRFTVLADGDGSADHAVAGTAALRYGPAAIGAAAMLRAQVHGDTTMWFDPDRRDDTVDLMLGAGFGRLATTIEANQALVAVGEPSAPPPCSTAAPSISRR